jgi:chemotaxis protein MotA
MLAILGFLIVIGAVLGGFLLEKGPLPVLMQLPELLIIGGAATGTLLVANPPRVLKGIVGGVVKVLGKSPFSRENYLSTLKMLYELLNKSRRLGMLGIEPDIENPDESQLFQAYPNFLKNHHYRDFVCDTMRMALTGNVDVFDMDQMIERDIEVHHHGAMQPVSALITAADSLPGLGIVAAVLGVVITMSALDGPPSEIGHKVAAALVGTFLGILMCYGFVGPLGASMSKLADEENAYFYVMRIVLISYLRGQPPVLAIEAGRRAIPAHVRPSFAEVEEAYRGAAVSGGEVSEGSEAEAVEA